MAIAASAMTVEEFAAKTQEEKVKVLTGKPERSLDDSGQLLRLYTVGLRDPSPVVKRTAAQAAVFLVMGLQSAQGSGKLPTFSSEDSASLQQTLVVLLNDNDVGIRISAASALAYSAAPNPAIETLLLARVQAEHVPEIKAAVIEAMAQAGYQSPQLIAEATALVQPSPDSKAIYSASKVLAHLRPESALDTLVALASKASPSQRHALQALAAYGQGAARAIPVLERLVTDQAMPEDIRNLARITLEALKAGKPQPSALQPMNPVNLWPVALSPSSPAAPPTPAPEQSPAPATPRITSTPSPPSTTPMAQTPAVPSERKAPVWPWVVGLAALIVIVALAAKRRG